ncbi:MAG: hypothetical protein ACLFU8_09195 [Anaerolineales bacterium]
MTLHRFKRVGLSLALAVLGLAVVWGVLGGQPAQAQSGSIFVDKRLGRGDPVVYVGEYMTFTLQIRNDAAFTVTVLPLRDTFNAAVLRYVDASPAAPDVVNQAGGELNWTDLTTYFGDLAPGQEVWLTVGFVAEHPAPAIVNAAEAYDVEGSQGEVGGGDSTVTDTVAVGGSAPVEKTLLEGLNPQVGALLTFTIAITNQGYVTLTHVPLVDDYNPQWMAFSYADPPPDAVLTTTGVLSWTDITSWTGDIPPFQAVTITTVFTALASADEMALNRAEVEAASDWYGNDLAGGADEVPITIINQPTPTPPTPTPSTPSTPSPPSAPTATPTALPTPTPVIMLLPVSGHPSSGAGWRGWSWLVVFALVAGSIGLRRYSQLR